MKTFPDNDLRSYNILNRRLFFVLREPAASVNPKQNPRLVSLRRSGSPCAPPSASRRSPFTAPQAGGFRGQRPGRALSCSAVRGACTPRLRLGLGLPSGLRKPAGRRCAPALVLLRGLRSPLAPSLRSGAAGLLRLLGKPSLP